MKRTLVLLFAVAVMTLVVALPAMAFFGFGYTHGIPLNDSKLWAGFDFGPADSTFSVDAYLADIWTMNQSVPASPAFADVCLGIDAAYNGDVSIIDMEIGTYMETTPLVNWPTVLLNNVGFYGDFTVHLLDGAPVTWDLFASFDLNVTLGIPALSAEVGFEVEL